MMHRQGSRLFVCLLAGILAAATGCSSTAGKVPTAFPDPNVPMFTPPDTEGSFAEEDLSGAAEDAEEGQE